MSKRRSEILTRAGEAGTIWLEVDQDLRDRIRDTDYRLYTALTELALATWEPRRED